MQETIIEYLIENEGLNKVIWVKDSLFPIYALVENNNFDNLIEPVMEYQYRDLKGGYEKQSQFSINIIGTSYSKIVKVQRAINKVLDFNLSTTFLTYKNIKFNSQISGGSTPLYREDLKLYQVNLNFLMKWRYVNE